MLKVYSIFSFILNFFAPLFFKYRVIKKKDDPKRYLEKLGIYNRGSKNKLIWFHASSLGELKSVENFIKNIITNTSYNGYTALVTTTTKSSGEYAEKSFDNNIIHQYAPIDSPQVVKKFLDHWKPEVGIFIESEIWPNLILQSKKYNISLILLNARFSPTSLNRWKKIPKIFLNIMKNFKIITTMSDKLNESLLNIGLTNTKFVGNLKFYDPGSKIVSYDKNENIFVGMSIHPEELSYLISAHKEISRSRKNFTSIIIPRHINKIKTFEEKLKSLNCNFSIFSNKNNIKPGIILIDQYNVAEKFFKFAKVVFMGGSFIEHGGQNPLEPARINCKVLHGPSIYNFDEIYSFLKENNISSQVNDEKDLINQINTNLNNNNQESFCKIINDHGENIFRNNLKLVDNFIKNEIK